MKTHYRKLAPVYPAYHPLAGKETRFQIKVKLGFKVHTIREYNPKVKPEKQIQVGDFIQFQEWQGKPYNSGVNNLQRVWITKIYDFEINVQGDYLLNGKVLTVKELECIAMFDGFSHVDHFECWFSQRRTFKGKLYCWEPTLDYEKLFLNDKK